MDWSWTLMLNCGDSGEGTKSHPQDYKNQHRA